MVFSSIFFLFVFLPLALLAYYAVPFRFKNVVLLLCSLLFYAWGEPVYVFLMLFSIGINFFSGLQIEQYRREGRERNAQLACVYTVMINLAVLGFYKYYGFLLENLNALLPVQIPYRELALPIGISFYTFQTLSYVVDVYRGKVEASHNLISFGVYVSMFPQLIAGPIVRYSDIERQLAHRRISWQRFGEGAQVFLCGLGKKVLLANQLGGVYDSIAALGIDNMTVVTAWIGCFAYMMQIYFDFSGYSDMAIGLGKMLGFDFIPNFNYPYIADSIRDFWKRWHMSLSSWFLEYVYIPLGGSREGRFRTIRNLMITWMLTGMWHGAAWNFIFWGLYYGVLLVLERYVWGQSLRRWPGFARHLYTLFFVMIGWVLFFSTSLAGAGAYVGVMFGIGAKGFLNATTGYFFRTTFLLGLCAVVGSTPVVKRWLWRITHLPGSGRKMAAVVVYGGVFLLSVAYLVNETYNPFLYFRF